MSLVLVVARPRRPAVPGAAPPAAPRDEAWRAVRDEVRVLHAGALDRLAEAIAVDPDDPTVSYAARPCDAVRAVERSIADGAGTIAVLPVALAVDEPPGALRDPELARLPRELATLAEQHPGVDIGYVGPPFDQAPALEAAIAALRPAGSDEPALLVGAVERAFDGDLDRFARFVSALQGGVPGGTRLALRGSAVQGTSYRTGEPFDARGPGTSDLDVVLIGEEAMAAWSPEAFYLPGVNSQPLDDAAPDVADPRVDRARREAQAAARRPVALQAMARWFLDLRSGLQGTRYVLLGG